MRETVQTPLIKPISAKKSLNTKAQVLKFCHATYYGVRRVIFWPFNKLVEVIFINPAISGQKDAFIRKESSILTSSPAKLLPHDSTPKNYHK